MQDGNALDMTNPMNDDSVRTYALILTINIGLGREISRRVIFKRLNVILRKSSLQPQETLRRKR